MDDARFRIGDVEWGQTASGQPTVKSRGRGAAIPLSVAQARLIAGSVQHRPLEHYALQWARQSAADPLRRITGWAPAAVRGWVDRSTARMTPSDGEMANALADIRSLADAGVLVSDIDFTRSLQNTATDSDSATISRVGFPTRGRPEALRRAIASYCENGREANRKFEFVIVDDSREESGEEQTREILADLQTKYGFAMRFAGLAERESYAQKLAEQSGVDPALAQFSVLGDTSFPLTTGSVRNCVLLDCANEPVLMGDDDAICRIAPWATPKPGVAFSSAGDPTEFLFYENREDTLAATQFQDIDLLAQHERLLGQSLGDVIAQHAETPELHTLSPRTQARMMRDGGNVQITMAGNVGDSGIGSSAYLFVGDNSLKQLARSESFYHAAVASRQVNRAVERPTMGDFAFCMSTNLAIDTRSLPPLFTPVMRNSDGTFGRLLRDCHPGAYAGTIPYSVLHSPLDLRSYSLEFWQRDSSHIRYCDVLLMLIAEWGKSSEIDDSADAYSRVAAHLQHQALSADTLFGELQRIAQNRSSARVARLEASPVADLPEFLTKLRREGAEHLVHVAEQPNYVTPSDMRAISNDDAHARESTRQLTLRIAQLYAVWPALWRGANELAQQGIRLTRPV